MSKVTLNIDTDLDELIKKCNELNKQLEELGDKSKQLHFVNVKELADMLRLFTKHSKSNFSTSRFS